MARINYKKLPGKVVASAALMALLGPPAAQLAVEVISSYEGYVPEAYRDPVGIWTKCFGDTTGVTPGAKYSFEECVRSLNDHTLELAKPVVKCVPDLLKHDPLVIASFVSMSYNIGSGAFCKSSVAKMANRGDWRGACKRISEIYTTAKGKKLPGLVKRRADESQMCLRGVEKEGL